MDSLLTEEQIQKVADDFLTAVEGYPPRIRTKIWNQVLGQGRTPAGYLNVAPAGHQAGKSVAAAVFIKARSFMVAAGA